MQHQYQSRRRQAPLRELNDETNGPRFVNVLDRKKEVRHYIYNFINYYNKEYLRSLLDMKRLRFGKLGLEEFICAWLCKEIFRISNVKELYHEYKCYYAFKHKLDQQQIEDRFPCYEQYVVHVNKSFELYDKMQDDLKSMVLGSKHISNNQ